MGDGRKWMYEGWKKFNGNHSSEWVAKATKFVDHAFSLSNNGLARCPCKNCRNGLSHDKLMVSKHIFKFGFMPHYEVWIHHGEEGPENEPVAVHDVAEEDRMDEMLDALYPEFEADFEDPPTPEVQKFFELLKASEQALHEHTTMSILTLVTRLMSIKSKYAFSNNCY